MFTKKAKFFFFLLLSFFFFGQIIRAESPNLFLKTIQPKLQNIPHSGLELRLLKEYGSLWVSRDLGILSPPTLLFASEKETLNYQNKLNLTKLNSTCALQEPALKALKKAQKIAQEKGLSISPRGADSCLRSYNTTYSLWLSRVEPNLAYYVKNGKIKAEEAKQIKNLSTINQINAILALEEKRGLSFDKYRNGSILSSVAAPGSSQHLSGLAFDVTEYANPQVKQILNQYGWFQTVKNDLPHFTYLGFTSTEELKKAGLKSVNQNGFVFWIPNL